MSLFLNIVTVQEAVDTARRIAVPPVQDKVPVMDAFCRVLDEDVYADVDIPGFTRSVVDGYAVRAADTTGASDSIPSMLAMQGRVAMGEDSGQSVGRGKCIYVPTGGILPEGADAVVMKENTELFGEDVLVKKAVAHGENVLFYNEDFSKGELALKKGRKLSAQDIGVLAAVGCSEVPVTRMPRVAILSTGNELVPVTKVPGPGQVRDVNTYVVSSFVRDFGCIPVAYGITRDDREAFYTTLQKALAECDAVIISGGSSKDDRDMAAAVIAEHGEVLIHGVAIAPGKPTIIGRCGEKPVIGLPGHPASAFIVLLVIGRHLLTGMTGQQDAEFRKVPARLATNVASAKGREEYVRVALKDGVATPLFGKSGLLNTLVRSNGVVKVPAGREGLERDEQVEVILW